MMSHPKSGGKASPLAGYPTHPVGLFCILFGWVGGLAASSGWPRFGRNGVRHAMKSKTKLQRVDYTFRRDQVLSANIGEFLRIYDPTRLSPFHLRCLFGRLRLAIEDVMECEDAATIPEARKLILTLHAAWPWAGFFLNLDRPFGSSTTLGALPILAYAMCLVDMRLVACDRTRQCALHLDGGRVRKFRDQCFEAIDTLGERAEIPPEVLAGRKDAVAQQLDQILQIP